MSNAGSWRGCGANHSVTSRGATATVPPTSGHADERARVVEEGVGVRRTTPS